MYGKKFVKDSNRIKTFIETSYSVSMIDLFSNNLQAIRFPQIKLNRIMIDSLFLIDLYKHRKTLMFFENSLNYVVIEYYYYSILYYYYIIS